MDVHVHGGGGQLQVETIEDGVSTFSSFSPALEEGSALYQFIPESKTAQHTVRAILK